MIHNRIALTDYLTLVDAGVIGRVEMSDGIVSIGNFDLAFSPVQIAAAAELGIILPSCCSCNCVREEVG